MLNVKPRLSEEEEKVVAFCEYTVKMGYSVAPQVTAVLCKLVRELTSKDDKRDG